MLNHRIGTFFALPIVFTGAIISLIGVISVFQVTIFGVFLIPIGLFFITSSYGCQIDNKNNLYREYESYLGFKRGKWVSLSELSFVSVLKSRSGMTYYSQSNRSTSLIDDSFEVYLLNSNHRLKILIQKFDTKMEATNYAKKLSILVNKEMTSYNPVVSEKTRLRRNLH